MTASAINTKLTKEFYVLNFRAEKYILNKKISLIVQIDNIFDKSYSDLLGAQMPGRWIQGGFSLNLEK